MIYHQILELRNRDRKLAMSKILIYLLEGASGCPGVKTVHSQCKGAWVQPLVEVLRSLMP